MLHVGSYARAYFVSGSHYPAGNAYSLLQTILRSQARLSTQLQADKYGSSHFPPRVQGRIAGARKNRRKRKTCNGRQKTRLSSQAIRFIPHGYETRGD
jgi:hypothetical protein